MPGLQEAAAGFASVVCELAQARISGLQVAGKGVSPRAGQTVVIDWDGYTIGYYGRPFEARNKVSSKPFFSGCHL